MFNRKNWFNLINLLLQLCIVCVSVRTCVTAGWHKDRLRDTQRGIQRKYYRKVRGENGLCRGWRWIITVFLSLSCRVLSPQPQKEQQHEATSCSGFPVMEGNLHQLSPWSCFYRSQHSMTFTVSSSWIVNTKLYGVDMHRHRHTHAHIWSLSHAHRDKHPHSHAPCLFWWYGAISHQQLQTLYGFRKK